MPAGNPFASTLTPTNVDTENLISGVVVSHSLKTKFDRLHGPEPSSLFYAASISGMFQFLSQ
jgi:hypothetical protein